MALYRAVESRPVMAAGMMTRECVGREIIRAGVAVTAVGDAGTGRRTRSLQRGPVGRQPGSRSWRPSIQNVQIGIIEREQARLLDGGPYGPVGLKSFFGLYPESCRFLIYRAPTPTGACANAGVAAVADSSTAAARALNEIIFVSPVWIDCRPAWDETN